MSFGIQDELECPEPTFGNAFDTFHDYLTLKRIHIAEELLVTEKPITDIAFQTGFNTLPSFCRAFKKWKDIKRNKQGSAFLRCAEPCFFHKISSHVF